MLGWRLENIILARNIMKEIERKILITCRQYESICFQLKDLYPSSFLEQTNYYYDSTSYMLFKQNETLRVREQKGKLEAQYKFNKRYVNYERNCDEVSWSVVSLPSTLSAALLGKYNEKYEKSKEIFSILGTLTTERKNFYINNLIFSVDKNFYLGYIDCELEIEGVTEENISFVNAICAELGLENIKPSNKKGKYTRFLSRYFDIQDHYKLQFPLRPKEKL